MEMETCDIWLSWNSVLPPFFLGGGDERNHKKIYKRSGIIFDFLMIVIPEIWLSLLSYVHRCHVMLKNHLTPLMTGEQERNFTRLIGGKIPFAWSIFFPSNHLFRNLPPPKTNMTSWKIHHEWRCISDWKFGDFPASHVIVFSGVT